MYPRKRTCKSTSRQLRQLEASVREVLNVQPVLQPSCEVFSPPRFSPIAEQMGFASKSYDLLNGFDFRRATDRREVLSELGRTPPDLLVLCPPCTDEGG